MSIERIKETFLRLPRYIKMVGIGGLILAISTILPWYADTDSYKIGDQFLGVTGPASFVGIAILLLSGLSLWLFSYHLLERRIPRLPVREGIIHLFTSIESLFLLVLVNSIFFHPKFGVNITLKESRFGMTFAFAGAVILLIGGYLKNKQEAAEQDETGKLEPLIKMDETPGLSVPSRKPTSTSYFSGRPHAPVTPSRSTPLGQSPAEVAKKFFQPQHSPMSQHAKDASRGFLFGEPKKVAANQPAEQPAAPSANPAAKADPKSASGSYMIRLDL